jgi:peptide/nickel transport system permease protein
MLSYLVKRILWLFPVVLGVSTLVFFMVHLTPGGPARAVLGEKATPEAIERINRENGWDRPLPVQYTGFLYSYFVRFDPGKSFIRGERISTELARTFPATVELSLAAMLIAALAGIGAGVLSAVKKNSVLDYTAMTGSLVGISIPVFFLGLILILVLGDWFPTGGRLHVACDLERVTGLNLLDSLIAGRLDVFSDALAHLLLPAVALATIPMALIARMTRASMLEVLGHDYIRTARAKGLSARKVVLKHALRNAFIPIVTATGLQFGTLLAGAVLTETLFQWPGLGRYVVDAVHDRDYNAVQGGILLIAVGFVLVNLLVDLSYAFLNPKVRYGTET